MAVILGSISISVAWFIYRHSLLLKRNNFIVAINEILETTGMWFGTSYPLDLEREEWGDSSYMVYKVDTAIINSIIVDGGYILGNDIVKRLVQFSQLVTRFNQYVDVHIDFVNSNYEEIREKKKKIFIDRMYSLMNKLHTRGIGSNSCHSNPPNFPFLHKCFVDLKNKIKKEESENLKVLYWKKFLLFDFVIFYICGVLVSFELFKFIFG